MKSVLTACLVTWAVLAIASGAEPAETGGAKSLRKALLFSLLLPGAGQQYLGNTGRARMMYVSEAGIWTSFAGFRIQGRMREDRYKEVARLFAGVQGDRDDDYYMVIAHYVSNEAYNIDVMREARYLYPDSDDSVQVKQRQAYFEANGYFGADAWEWESLEHQREFELTRTRSRESYRRAVLTTGFAVLNRVVSMIDVYLSFRLAGTGRGAPRSTLRLEHGPNESFRVSVSMSF